jgi:hypothetical protein
MAQVGSLRQLRSFGSADQATTAAVEAQVGRIRQALGLPPPAEGVTDTVTGWPATGTGARCPVTDCLWR